MKNKGIAKICVAILIGTMSINFYGCGKEENDGNVTEQNEVLASQKTGMIPLKEGKVQYVSKDSVFSLTLPDASWKLEKELDILHSFTNESGSIHITHVVGADAKKVLPIYEEKELEKQIEKSGEAGIQQAASKLESKAREENDGEENTSEELSEFEIQGFQCNVINSVNYYQYGVEYQNSNTDAYALVLGIQGEKEIYEMVISLKEKEYGLLEQMEQVRDSFLLIKEKDLEDGLSRAKTFHKSTTDGSVEADGLELVESEGGTDKKKGSSYVCVSSANVRNRAGMNSSVIGSIETGDNVKVISEDGGWYEIEYENTTGYVYEDYIEKQ